MSTATLRSHTRPVTRTQLAEASQPGTTTPDVEAARARAGRIVRNMASLAAEIQAAWDNNDHITLGYETWQSYTVGEFGRGNTAIAARQAIVGLLRGTGLSERAIAAEIGSSPATTHNDLADLAAAQPIEQLITIPDPPAVVTGLDGRPHPASTGGMTAPERRAAQRQQRQDRDRRHEEHRDEPEETPAPPAAAEESAPRGDGNQAGEQVPAAGTPPPDPKLTSAQRIQARDLLTELREAAFEAKMAMTLSGDDTMTRGQWQERYEAMTAGLRGFTEGL